MNTPPQVALAEFQPPRIGGLVVSQALAGFTKVGTTSTALAAGARRHASGLVAFFVHGLGKFHRWLRSQQKVVHLHRANPSFKRTPVGAA